MKNTPRVKYNCLYTEPGGDVVVIAIQDQLPNNDTQTEVFAYFAPVVEMWEAGQLLGGN